jgi:hypothetical protein
MGHKIQFLLALTRVTTLIVLATSMTSQGQTPSRFPVNDKCSLNFKEPTAAFDVEHDKDTVGGGSLFCRLGVTASQAVRAISDFKAVVAEPDQLSAHSILTFPLEVVIPHTKSTAKQQKIPTLMIRTSKEWAVWAHRRSRKKLRNSSADSSAAIPCSTCIWWLRCGWLSTVRTEPQAPALGSAAA